MRDRLSEIVDEARVELRNWLTVRHSLNDQRPVGDVIEGIATNAIPVFTKSLLDIASENLWLVVEEPTEESATAFDCLSGTIKDHVRDQLLKEYRTWVDEETRGTLDITFLKSP